MNTRIRRLRTEKAFDEVAAKKLLKSIAIQMESIAALNSALSTDRDTLSAMLQEAGGKSVSIAVSGKTAFAEVVRSAGKSQNIIDPKALQKKLKPEEFLQCISVSVTKTRGFLGEKELALITTTIPGTTGEPTLKVSLK